MSIILLMVLSLVPLVSRAADQSGSLLGKPVSALVGSLDRYTIEVGQTKGTRAPIITSAAARYALLHSELVDPTLPEVRNNAFPLIAEVRLRHRERTNEVARLDFCGGLGLLHGGGPVPYVFRYRLPVDSNEKKSGSAEQ